ncbi:hypothetical protein EG68_03741 [Paragonimus skrjabini miyazakii]|uniref:Oxysterol-binding protein n=1 Tax=Paragonimus skrjabini miyazakii TaxID=59628 RepID=A0A8S9Z002_9TREM|nr:hypothetical protein EG68_03741 [Paragonimus skrjabini miyazakii]
MTDTCTVSGYLYKWTNIIKGYQKRWFLLQNNLLSYYRNPEAVGRRCRGTFDLENATLFAPNTQTSFILTESSGRKHHLKALSEEDKNRWIKALSALMKTARYNTDIESDTYSEDSVVIGNQRGRPGSTGNRRRFFRNPLSGLQKSNSRHSSSSHLPQEEISNQKSTPISHQENQASTVLQTDHPTGHLKLDDQGSAESGANNGFSVLVNRLHQTSASAELSALLELLSSVESFRVRLKDHTYNTCSQLTAIESMLSTPEANSLWANYDSASSGTFLESNGAHDTRTPNARMESEPIARRIKDALGEHHRCIQEFRDTCLEALQFLVTNFERWHRKLLAEQERCLGLERTVEQLARQHRALELQLSRCYASFEDTGFDVSHSSRGGTLRRTETRDIREFENTVHSEHADTADDDQFFDAVSLQSANSYELLNIPEQSQKVTSLKSLGLPRSEGIRASATSLESLKNADESSGSDSCSEEHSSPTRIHRSTRPPCSILPLDKKKELSVSSTPPPSTQGIRKRRSTIPPSPKIALNLWSIIKNGIGKDITKIPLPVNFNEPISFLQRASEDMTYSDLLDRASETRDPAEQMSWVAAFSVSCYASTAIRTGKPFNPLLGETFEFDRSTESFGWRLIAEQVSHHPPGSALYCESVRYGWKIWVEFVLVSKFRGKYMSVYPKGTVNLLLPDGSRYTWTKATTVVHNLIVGTLWIDNYGDVVIRNHTNGYHCPMRFIAHSYFSRGPPKQVTGVVKTAAGTPVRLIQGTWDSHIEYQVVSPDGSPIGEPFLLWRATPLPPEAEKIYYFSQFAVALNEPEPNVAPTDSRLRTDQRLMEEGAWDQANEEKRRLEQKQRLKRYRWEEQKAAGVNPLEPLFTPIWFELRTDSVTGEQSHVYRGNYWQAKAEQNWSACPDLF